MRKAILALRQDPPSGLNNRLDNSFVIAHLISSFIAGLTTGHNRGNKAVYLSYIESNFPDLCNAFTNILTNTPSLSSQLQGMTGAEFFYTHLRNKAMHEFAPKPPLALAHNAMFDNTNPYVKIKPSDGQTLICLNVDKLIDDFLGHLSSEEQSLPR